ncbi:hypothetical protein T492DRAFT_848516, partial [Pavlovales sp. CCMP2436]
MPARLRALLAGALLCALGPGRCLGALSSLPTSSASCAVTEAEDCVARNAGAEVACGFCGSSWSCMAGDKHGPSAGSVGCEPSSLPSRGLAILAADYPSSLPSPSECAQGYTNKLYAPEGDWRTPACRNGGAKHYRPPNARGIERNPIWGGQLCDCPNTHSGLTCAACATDSACAEGETCQPELMATRARFICSIEETSPDNA